MSTGLMGLASLADARPIHPDSRPVLQRPRCPGEVRVAAIDMGYAWMRQDQTWEERLSWIESRVRECLPAQPDIVCLPETFASSWVAKPLPPEPVDGPLVRRVGAWAREAGCYFICPLRTLAADGRVHNSAVLLDRSGAVAGVSHKARLTKAELAAGTMPGPLDPPVFPTDFGTLGIQICYDANWSEQWTSLRQRGARIIFFPSEFHGGKILNARAWMTQCWIVTSTAIDARIIDPGGDDLVRSGNFRGYVCATVDLDAELIHIWPHIKKLPELQRLYGDALQVKIWQEENYFLLQSRDPSLRPADLLARHDIPTYAQQLASP